MINSQMKNYNYYAYTETENAYGEKEIGESVVGFVKMAINELSHSLNDSILYNGASYLGLTFSNSLNDGCFVDYCGNKLKVIYVQQNGRYKQIFMAKVD